MTDWFIRQSGNREDIGPLKPGELLKMVRQGEVERTTQVRKDDSAWFPAGNVGGLFEAAMRPTIEHFCPTCQAEVSEPPTVCGRCDTEIQEAVTRITENSITARTDPSVASQASQSMRSWLERKRVGKKKNP